MDNKMNTMDTNSTKDCIIVTGGFGMVGMALQKVVTLTELNNYYNFYFLSRKDCDLRNKTHVYNIFQTYQPRIVIHLASRVGGVYDNMNNNYDFLSDNATINLNIVNACKEFKVRRLINILSTCIFPDNGVTYPLSSDQLHNGLPHYSNIGYAYSKRLLHVASELLCQASDTQVVNLIPTNLYGEHDNYNLICAHVVPALVHKVFIAKQTGQPLHVKGSGNAVRQFLYADDFANIIINFIVMELPRQSITCIASPPRSSEVSIKQLVDNICNAFEFTGDILYDTSFPDGQFQKTTDDTELSQIMCDSRFNFTPLETGINHVVQHFVQHYSCLRTQ